MSWFWTRAKSPTMRRANYYYIVVIYYKWLLLLSIKISKCLPRRKVKEDFRGQSLLMKRSILKNFEQDNEVNTFAPRNFKIWSKHPRNVLSDWKSFNVLSIIQRLIVSLNRFVISVRPLVMRLVKTIAFSLRVTQ